MIPSLARGRGVTALTAVLRGDAALAAAVDAQVRDVARSRGCEALDLLRRVGLALAANEVREPLAARALPPRALVTAVADNDLREMMAAREADRLRAFGVAVGAAAVPQPAASLIVSLLELRSLLSLRCTCQTNRAVVDGSWAALTQRDFLQRSSSAAAATDPSWPPRLPPLPPSFAALASASLAPAAAPHDATSARQRMRDESGSATGAISAGADAAIAGAKRSRRSGGTWAQPGGDDSGDERARCDGSLDDGVGDAGDSDGADDDSDGDAALASMCIAPPRRGGGCGAGRLAHAVALLGAKRRRVDGAADVGVLAAATVLTTAAPLAATSVASASVPPVLPSPVAVPSAAPAATAAAAAATAVPAAPLPSLATQTPRAATAVAILHPAHIQEALAPPVLARQAEETWAAMYRRLQRREAVRRALGRLPVSHCDACGSDTAVTRYWQRSLVVVRFSVCLRCHGVTVLERVTGDVRAPADGCDGVGGE